MSFLTRAQRSLASRRSRHEARRQKSLRMEHLEDRALMATLIWMGDALDSNWNTNSGGNTNWFNSTTATDNVLPLDGDVLQFTGNLVGASNNNTTANNSYTLEFTAGGYTITGNAITLDNAGDDVLSSTGTTTISAPLVLVADSTFAINGGGVTAGGILSGAGGEVNKTGAGTLTLTNTANSFTGAVDILGGVLEYTGQGAADPRPFGSGAKNVTLTNNAVLRPLTASDPSATTKTFVIGAGGGTFDIPSGSSLLLNDGAGATGQLQGAGTLTVTGTGGVFTSGGTSNNMTGKLVIAGGGIMSVSADGHLGQVPGAVTPDAITLNGGTLRVTTAFTINANRGITLGPGVGTIESTAATTFNGVIAGSGILRKIGAANLILGGSNTYSGGTSIEQAAIQVTADTQLGAVPGAATPGNIVLSGGSLLANATFTLNANRGIALGPTSGAGTGTINVGTGFTLTYGGALANNGAGTGGLLKTGPGQLTLSGGTPNTHTGLTTVNTGVLLLNKTPGVDAIGSAGFTITTTTTAVGIVRLAAAGQIPDSAPIVIGADASGGPANFDLATFPETVGEITLRNTTNTAASGLTGATITGTGTGVLTLNGNVTFNYNRNDTGNVPANLAISAPINLGGQARTFTVNTTATGANVTGSDAAINGTISNGTIIKEGARRLDVLGAATGIPNIDVNAGELMLRNAANSIATINANGGRTIFTLVTALGGATVNVANGASLTGSLAAAATLTNVVNVAAGGNISARGQTLTLSAANTNLSAPIAAGLLKLNVDEATTAGLVVPHAITLVNNLTLEIGAPSTGTSIVTFSGVVSGGFSITKTGQGSWQPNQVNTYTGDTTIAGGAIRVTGNIAPSTNGNLGNSANAIIFETTSSERAALFTDGAGALTISRAIDIRNGSTGTNVIGIASTQDATLSSLITLGDDLTFQVNNNTFNVTSLLADSGGSRSISKIGAASLLLSNASNSYTGTTTILDGTVLVGGNAPSGGNSVLGNSTGAILLGDTTGATSAALLANGAFTVSRPINVRAGSTGAKAIGGNSASTSTFNGPITLNDHLTLRQNSTGTVNIDLLLVDSGGARNITKDGTGTVVFGSAQAYTGTTTISAGSLRIQGAGTLGAGPAGTIVASGGTLDLNNLSSALTEPLRIVGAGAGSVGAINSTAGNNTVSGAITITGNSTLGAASGATLTMESDLRLPLLSALTVTGAGDTVLTGNLTDSFFNGFASGLTEGLITGNAFDITTANPGTLIVNDPAFGVALMGNKTVAAPGASQAQANHVWGLNETWVYTGQFFDADGFFAFAEDIDDSTFVKIDGAAVLQNTGHTVPTTTGSTTGFGAVANANPVGGTQFFGMGPSGDGWHNIEVRFGNATGGAGATGGQTGWSTTKGFGLRDSTTLLDSTNGNDYAIPVDPGDASLFRTPVNATVLAAMNALTRVVKTGTGTFRIAGTANDYRGAVEVRAGVLVAADQTSLGTTDSGTRVLANGTLALENVSLVGEDLQLNGAGAAGQAGALVNGSLGNSSYTGAITAEVVSTGAFGIGSAVGQLTLNGTIDPKFSQLIFSGAGNVVVNSPISGTASSLIVNSLRETWYPNVFSDTNLVNPDPGTNPQAYLSLVPAATTFLNTNTDLNFDTPALTARSGLGAAITGAPASNRFGTVWLGSMTVGGLLPAGNITLSTNSDDGSVIYVDKNLNGAFEASEFVVDNRGGHAAQVRQGTINLAAGTYPVIIAYFESSGGGRMEAKFASGSNVAYASQAFINPGSPAQNGIWSSGEIANNTVVKNGTGTVTLAGDNAYNGSTRVNAGTLVVAHNAGLGLSSAGTTVHNGATLALDNTIADTADNALLDNSANLIVAEPISLDSGGTLAESTLRNIRGNNTLTGNVSVAEYFAPPFDISSSLGVGLELWLDASNLASIVDANGGTLNSGDPISGWNDTLGGGNTISQNAVQLTASRQPTYIASSLNGLPAIRFAAVDNNELNSDDLQVSGLTLGNNVTIFAVVQHALQNDNAGSSVRPFFVGNFTPVDGFTAPGDGYTLALQRPTFASGNGFRVESPGYNDKVSNIPIANDLQFHMYSFSRNGTATNGVQVFFDGGATPILTGTSPNNATDTVYSIGGENSANAFRQYTGDIPEIIAFNRTLSTAERQSVEAYLQAKYFGVGVPATPGQGTIASNADTLTLTGQVAFPKLTVSGNGNVVLNGQLQNAPITAGQLVKDGTGTATLGASNSYTGTTTINAGTLNVNGSTTDGPAAIDVSVGSNATLGGTGVVHGAIAVASGGKLAPGAGGPGTLALGNSSLTFGALASFNVEINGDFPGDAFGFHDQITTLAAPLNVAGVVLSATLIDTLANPYPFSASPSPTGVNAGDVYVIVENQSIFGVSGVFVNALNVPYNPGDIVPVAGLNPSLVARITYTHNGASGGANDVALLITANNAPPTITNAGPVNVFEPNASNSGTFNDTDAGNIVSIVVTSGGGSVSQTGTQSGAWTWTRTGIDGLSSPTTFTVILTATDSGGLSATTSFNVSVSNAAPTANPDSGASFTTNEGSAFTTGNVLTNDTDPAGPGLDPLSVSSVNTAGLVGLLTNNGNGTFLYNPNGQFESLPQGGTATTSFGYTITDGDNGFSTSSVTITITGVNDAATITVNGAQDTNVTEAGGLNNTIPGDPTAGGDLDANDVDSGEARFQTPGTLNRTYGVFTFDATTGAWTYTLDNTRAATQALLAGQTVVDSLTVVSFDGTASFTINVTVTGANDTATITPNGAQDANVVEAGGVANGLPGDPVAGGDLDANDVDAGQAAFQTPGSLSGVYGTFAFNPTSGLWSYTLDNARPATQALIAGQTVTESLGVVSQDGTATFTINVTVTGANDTAAITVTGTPDTAAIEAGGLNNALPGDPAAGGDLDIADVDAGQAAFQSPSGLVGVYGTFTFNASNGNWTYTLDNSRPATQALQAGQIVSDVLTVLSQDGSASFPITVSITGANDTPLARINGAATGSSSVAAGQSLPFTFSWTDPDNSPPTATYTVVNASNVQIAGGTATNGQTVSVTFPTIGSYTVKLTVNDGAPNGIGTAAFNVSVQRFFIDGDGNLVFGGENNGADKVVFGMKGLAVEATHTLNSKVTRYYLTPSQPGSRIIAFGQGQNDDFRVAANFPYAVEFHGGGGNDYLAGGSQNDMLFGDLGNDRLLGGAGDDSLDGGVGLDTADGGVGNDWIFGGDGNDSLTGNVGNDTILGGAGVDKMGGATGDDILDGGLGNDSLDGGAGNDILLGGDGDDTLNGGDGLDLLVGGVGTDKLNGQNGDDILIGDNLLLDPDDPYAEAEAIRDAWVNGSGNYNTRVDNMLASLLAVSQVQTDTKRETLIGGSGLDWFLSESAADKVHVFEAGERLNDYP